MAANVTITIPKEYFATITRCLLKHLDDDEGARNLLLYLKKNYKDYWR